MIARNTGGPAMLMRRVAFAALAAAMCSSLCAAEVSLAAARVGARDVAATAKFYQSAFGLHEVNRVQVAGNTEIMMNFGKDAAAAKASDAAQVIVMHRDANSDADPVPHVIFYVQDLKAVTRSVLAAGGRMEGEPIAFAGMQIAFGLDPAGNRFELIQRPVAR